MRFSCELCYVTRPTIGAIERHIETDHDVSGRISEYWEEVEVDESGDAEPTFLKDYA